MRAKLLQFNFPPTGRRPSRPCALLVGDDNVWAELLSTTTTNIGRARENVLKKITAESMRSCSSAAARVGRGLAPLLLACAFLLQGGAVARPAAGVNDARRA